MDFPTYKVTEQTYRYGIHIPDSNFFGYLVSTYFSYICNIKKFIFYFVKVKIIKKKNDDLYESLFDKNDCISLEDLYKSLVDDAKKIFCKNRIVPESDLFELRMESRQKTRITESL